MFKAIGSFLRTVTCGVWAEFTSNPRLYALFAAGPACMLATVYMVNVVADPRWEQPIEQLDILRMAIMILALTHGVVVVALAAVRVSGRGPGGFSFDVDSDDAPERAKEVHVEGNMTVTPKDGEERELPPWERKS